MNELILDYLNSQVVPFNDILVLSSGHSIMMSHNRGEMLNTGIGIKSASKESIEKYGLFSSGLNYNTYYPEAKVNDFNPSEEEFIQPVFRLLSACITNKSWIPTEFPEEVLKASMNLLVGQTVNCDHETDVGNAIGSVLSVEWQEASKQDGVVIPAGINGVLKIDAKSNPRIARGIMMDPPSIHSNSVTVQFTWEPSHKDITLEEFYDKLGTYDNKGNLYRRIATKIISYRETSLVSHGADPFAQKITDNGKLVNPKYAASVYYSLSDKVYRPKPMEILDYSTLISSTSTTILQNSDTSIFNNKELKNSNNENKISMNELQQFLESLSDVMGLSKESLTKESFIDLLKETLKSQASLSEENDTLKDSVSELTEKLTVLENNFKENSKFIEMGKSYISELRESTLTAYNKLYGEKSDNNIISLIESDTITVEVLKSLNKVYTSQLEEKFPNKCGNCGSLNITRGSAVIKNSDNTVEGDDSIEGDIRTLSKALKNKK